MRDYRQLEGFATRRTSRGAIVVELDLEADPTKRDPLWQESIRRTMPSESHWRREYRRDWTVAAGKAYYPEFQLAAASYIRRATALLDDVVYRGFDFGFRKAACVWLQRSRSSERVWVLRELMPENMDTYSFAVLVRYLSGQSDVSGVAEYPKAAAWLNWIRAMSARDPVRMPAPPWFGAGCHFVDFAGPEALKRSATVEHGKAERTDAAVFESLGLHLNLYYTHIEARETVMRKLLLKRRDGWPGILFDPSCHYLVQGFAGGICYPEATKANPLPTQPKRDGLFEHIHDALNYVTVNVVPPEVADGGRGSAEGDEDEDPGYERVSLKETRDSGW